MKPFSFKPKLCFTLTILLFSNYLTIAQEKKPLPRIAIAGLAIESSTFSPAVTKEEAFHANYGAKVFSIYPFMAVDSPLRQKAIWFPTLVGHALPGGAVTREAYEALVSKTLDSLKRHLPYDGLYFDIHGAMSVVGLEDPEGDFIQRIRKVIGKKNYHFYVDGPAWKCFLATCRELRPDYLLQDGAA